ncbi:proline-rich proteoglycan 2-like [Anguilla anguilla]|uniref:proline-rich proteoglycan 2-like n=1 Tax=Anguilla anguilla TaxID=7936 RepID=UPI0015AA0DEB|nr:proline-rich proteoglycan 2-like [Anguilla anguilla]
MEVRVGLAGCQQPHAAGGNAEAGVWISHAHERELKEMREGGEVSPQQDGPPLPSAPVSRGAAEPPVAGRLVGPPLRESQQGQLGQNGGQESAQPHAVPSFSSSSAAPQTPSSPGPVQQAFAPRNQREGGEVSPQQDGPPLPSAPVIRGAAEPPVAGRPVGPPQREPQQDQLCQNGGQESAQPHAVPSFSSSSAAPKPPPSPGPVQQAFPPETTRFPKSAFSEPLPQTTSHKVRGLALRAPTPPVATARAEPGGIPRSRIADTDPSQGAPED